MKIYHITTYDGDYWHYFKSNREAAEDLRDTFLTNRAPGQTAEVEVIHVDPTPYGIATTLQDFADQTRYGDA